MKNIVSDSIDLELSPDRLSDGLVEIANDPESLKNWRNCHLIGDVIRGDVTTVGDCLISKVSQSLEQEPTILAPVHSDVSVTSKLNQTRHSGDRWKAAGMFAVAASVALFAVLTYTPGLNLLNQNGNNIAQTADTTNTIALANTPTNVAAAQDEFSQMLVEHGEFTSATGMNGLLSYAKLVSNQPLGQ